MHDKKRKKKASVHPEPKMENYFCLGNISLSPPSSLASMASVMSDNCQTTPVHKVAAASVTMRADNPSVKESLNGIPGCISPCNLIIDNLTRDLNMCMWCRSDAGGSGGGFMADSAGLHFDGSTYNYPNNCHPQKMFAPHAHWWTFPLLLC